MTLTLQRLLILTLSLASLLLAGCGAKKENGKPATTSIQNIGSDTMVNLAQAWAEAYHEVDPTVSVEVSGAVLASV